MTDSIAPAGALPNPADSPCAFPDMRWRKMIALLIAMFAVSVSLAADSAPLIDIDFSRTRPMPHIKEQGEFNGPLPANVVPDFTGWNSSVVTARKITEGNRSFLRFHVRNLHQAVLFRIKGQPPIEEPGYYVLKVICRTPDSPLDIHIRTVPFPYRRFDKADIPVDPRWSERSFILKVENKAAATEAVAPDASDLALFVSLQLGITDIASIKLSRSDRASYVAEQLAKVERPAKGQVNLFSNSRFPLGMQAGWSFNRGFELEADPEEPGPSGAPSLKIQSDVPAHVYSSPFQPDDPETQCQVTFAYKSEGWWEAAVSGASLVSLASIRAKVSLPPSAQWKTVKVTFTPDLLDRGFELLLSGKGTLRIDSLMAWSGTEDRKYTSAGACEVALAPDHSQLRETRIFFADEPARLRYCASGNFAGATLKAKVVNIHGEERQLPEVRFDHAEASGQTGKLAMKTGVLDCAVFPDAPLGAFRVEAWAERDGKRISPCNELVFNRIRRPHYWGKDAPDSPFGGHFVGFPRIQSTMKAAGMNWVRLHDVFMSATCWALVEPAEGKWKFPDAVVRKYRDMNIKIASMIGTAPAWASYYSGTPSTEYFDMMYQPKNIEAFRNYVRTMVSHYRGVIDEFFFQNEPWGPTFWHKGYDPKTGAYDVGPDAAGDYAQLSKIAYEETKRANPDAIFYGFNSTADTAGVKWTKQVFDAGAYPYCDAIDYHYYNETKELGCIPDDAAEKGYRNAVGYIKAREPRMKPVINSEGNPRGVERIAAGEDDNAGLYKQSIPWTPQGDPLKTADMTCRYVISHLALGVKRIFLYADFCHASLLRQSQQGFPVLLAADNYPHPTLSAFSNMAWLLEDRKFVRHFPVGNQVWAYLFSGRDGAVAVISGREKATAALPDGLEVLDLFGNPVKGQAVYNGRLLYVVSPLPAEKLEAILTARK